MRIWTLHPRHLDAKGLVALWRETLLAKKVLEGGTRGYTRHPQLVRFRALPDPIATVSAYLAVVYSEACARGYHFDANKIGAVVTQAAIPATEGQLRYEWQHLLAKLARRDPDRHLAQRHLDLPEPHPLFAIAPGPVAEWERT